jgi:hypothetical protein
VPSVSVIKQKPSLGTKNVQTFLHVLMDVPLAYKPPPPAVNSVTHSFTPSPPNCGCHLWTRPKLRFQILSDINPKFVIFEVFYTFSRGMSTLMKTTTHERIIALISQQKLSETDETKTFCNCCWCCCCCCC